MMLLPPPRPATGREDTVTRKKHRDAMKNIFEPIPRLTIYLAGLGLMALLLSPWWASAFLEKFRRKPVFLSDDSQSIVVPTNPSTASVPVMGTNTPAAFNLTQFDGVRLDSSREDLDHRFNLILQNTRGMLPEIYVGRNIGDVELIDARFYNGQLKEVSMLMQERPLTVENAVKGLVDEYGEPQSQSDGGSASPGGGLASLDLGNVDAGAARKLAAYEHHRSLTWTDGKTQLDVTIHFMTAVVPQPISVLEVHLADTAWLAANQPSLGANPGVPAAASQLSP